MDCCLSAVQLDGTWRPMYGILRAIAGIPYMGWSARNFTKEVHMGLFQCLNKNVTRSSRLSYWPVRPIALLFFGSADIWKGRCIVVSVLHPEVSADKLLVFIDLETVP